MKCIRRTSICEAYRFQYDILPKELLFKILKLSSAKQGILDGKHLMKGDWIITRKGKIMVYGDAYFRKTFRFIQGDFE
jgi:hypothetical protein